jgi:hypothetical protein
MEEPGHSIQEEQERLTSLYKPRELEKLIGALCGTLGPKTRERLMLGIYRTIKRAS